MDYTASNMDRDVVNPSQIRTVIRTFKECLPTQLFPHRHEVPKTLIFAKTDSHADDIIQIVREELGEGNEFCQKITCQADRPETVEWLRLIKDHIAVSLSIEPQDLDLSPFDRKGGLGRFYDVFGAEYEKVLWEMNVELVA
ncbi:MAG: hypothetical protein K6F68_08555 [Clostridiales bacterium]|nr:hypothetical protein [Clostridiales bacterium]